MFVASHFGFRMKEKVRLNVISILLLYNGSILCFALVLYEEAKPYAVMATPKPEIPWYYWKLHSWKLLKERERH